VLALALLVLNHVNIIDVAGGSVLSNWAIEIEDGRIRAIADSSDYRPPADATLMDLPGRYVMPGLVEMHAHLMFPPLDSEGRPLPTFDRDTTLQILRVMLAFGITTVRDTGAPTEAAVTMRGLVARGEVTGPNILTAGRILNTGSYNHAIYVPVNSETEVQREVEWQAKAGVDFIKVYADMPPALVRAAIEEARRYNIPVIGHLQATTWTQAAEMGIGAICHAAPWSAEYLPFLSRAGYKEGFFGRVYWLEHVELNDPAIREMATTMASKHVPVDPTLMAFRTKFWGNDPAYTRSPRQNLAPARLLAAWPVRSNTADWTGDQYRAAKAQWPKLLAFVKLLYDRGVLLTAGTDTPFPWIIPGVSLHEELRLLKEAGIPTAAVLRMATLNAATALGRTQDLGSVTAGKQADLVVLHANPLVDLANTERIEMVLKGGRIYRPNQLLASPQQATGTPPAPAR